MPLALRCAVPLLLAATTLPAGPATAARSPVTLTVTGRGNTRTEVTLTRPLVLAKTTTPLSVTGCGRFGGFYLSRLGEPRDFGYIDVAAFDFAGLFYRQPLGLGDAAIPGVGGRTETVLPAGRYRAYLLGEGSRCTVRMPARGGLSVTIRPSTPVTVQYAAADAATVPGTTTRAGSTAFPVTIRPTTYAVAALHVWHRSAADPAATDSARTVTTCLDVVPYAACAPEHPVTGSAHSYQGRRHPDGSSTTSHTWYEYATPGTLSSGTVYAKATAASAEGPWHATAALLAFDV